jgi:hypothetical protein
VGRGWYLPDDRLYTLDVYIIRGPMAQNFIKRNRVISRTIQIRGDNTLEDLHRTIFRAFNRRDAHMFEFQVGGKGPMDRKARRYVPSVGMKDGSKPAGDVTCVTMGQIGLRVGDAFGYWFDFGDDWWHQIIVVAISEKAPRGEFPKVSKRVGKSPPQYADLDKES